MSTILDALKKAQEASGDVAAKNSGPGVPLTGPRVIVSGKADKGHLFTRKIIPIISGLILFAGLGYWLAMVPIEDSQTTTPIDHEQEMTVAPEKREAVKKNDLKLSGNEQKSDKEKKITPSRSGPAPQKNPETQKSDPGPLGLEKAVQSQSRILDDEPSPEPFMEKQAVPQNQAESGTSEDLPILEPGTLGLQAISWNPDPNLRIAVINDKILGEKDRVRGYRILAIQENQVILKGPLGKSYRLIFKYR